MKSVISPSRMKIHDQPGLPPMPLICDIARANRPPKAPANVAAEKNKAIRRPHCNEVADTRKEPTLGNAKEGAAGKKSAEVAYEAHAQHDEAPAHHD
jgi:hypothetical protein